MNFGPLSHPSKILRKLRPIFLSNENPSWTSPHFSIHRESCKRFGALSFYFFITWTPHTFSSSQQPYGKNRLTIMDTRGQPCWHQQQHIRKLGASTAHPSHLTGTYFACIRVHCRNACCTTTKKRAHKKVTAGSNTQAKSTCRSETAE